MRVQFAAQRSDEAGERGIVSVARPGQVGILGVCRAGCSCGHVGHKGRFCPTAGGRTGDRRDLPAVDGPPRSISSIGPWHSAPHHLVVVGAGVGASDIPA
jgi:hypothetical protein